MQITIDDKALKRMIKESPDEVRKFSQVFIRDGINAYWQKVNNTSPWQVGGRGGGVPTDTGNLRMAHKKEIKSFEGKVYVDMNKTKAGRWNYASLVHGGTSKMEGRPWLQYAKDESKTRIDGYKRRFLTDLVKALPKK